MSNNKNLLLVPCPMKEYGDYYISATTISEGSFLKVLKFSTVRDKDTESYFEEVAVTQLSEPITALDWSKYGAETESEYMGLIMAGHNDGKLSLWSVVQLIENQDKSSVNSGQLKTFEGIHSSKVTCIKHNIKPNIVATASNELVIVQIIEESNGGYNITVAMQCSNEYDRQEISSIAWNDKVPYIISVASQSGVVYIWDMKKNKIHLKIRDQSMQEDRNGLRTTVAWASDGIQIIIAYDDNEYPFLTQYHMSQTNAPYAEYHGGHNKSIYAIVNNPNDPNYILSLGRDNTLSCWSIRTQRSIYSTQFKEKILQVVWSPKLNDVALIVTQSLKIEVHQINFVSDPTVYTDEEEELPRWLTPKAICKFGWGGRFAMFTEAKSQISINNLDNEFAQVEDVRSFINKIESEDKNTFLDQKISELEQKLFASTDHLNNNDKNIIFMWVALKSIYNNNYNDLFKYFGFDKEKLIGEANSNIGKVKEKKRMLLKDLKQDKSNNAMVFWEEIETKPEINKEGRTSNKELEREKPMTVKEEFNRNINWNQLGEKHIKSSLVFGETELAMENAFHADRDAEALLIASTDPELFAKAKARYFSKSKDLYIKNVFSSIINKNFNQLLEHNMKEWKEYLLYALTYLDNNEFKLFSLTLGEKLISSGDLYSSIVCDLLGGEGLKAIEKLYSNYNKECENKSTEEKDLLLITLFEQVLSIHYILPCNMQNNTSIYIISSFCDILVSYRLYNEACSYLCKIKNPDAKTLLLLDRIFNLNEDILANIFKKPLLPFKEISVRPQLHNTRTTVKINQKNNNNEINHPNFIKPNVNQVSRGINNTFNNQGPNDNVKIGNMPNSLNHGNINSDINTNLNNPSKINQFGSIKNSKNIIKPPSINHPNSNFNNNINNINNNEKVTKDYQNPQFDNESVSSQGTNISSTINNNIRPPNTKIIRPPTITSMNNNINSKMPSKINNNINQPINSMNNQINNPMNNQMNNISNPINNNSHMNNNQINSNIPNNQNTQNTPQDSHALDQDDTTIISSFEKFQDIYNGIYSDKTRQKDFNNKVTSLFNKIKNGDIKMNLKKLLIQFIDTFNNGATNKELKMLVTKIQANQWDQNMTWMPCLDKLITMPKK